MPKSFCAPPICIRHKFNVAGAALQFSIGGVVPGAAVNALPDFNDYNAQWQKMRAGLLQPVDLNCDADCRCVKFPGGPQIANQAVPITLAEWQTMDGKTAKWEVTGVTVDISFGTCAMAGTKIKIGDGPWQNVSDIAPSQGFGPASGSGGSHESGGKKKKKKKAKRGTRGAKASRRR